MKISLYDLMGGEDVLFSAASGRACLAKLLGKVEEPDAPTLLLLDFEHIASATVSFLREGPLALREHLRSKGSNLYPVFANLNPAVTDSLADFLTATRDAVFVCVLDSSGNVVNARLVGQLDAKQNLTYEAVEKLGATTATELAEKYKGPENVGVTAWNNRLAALAGKGLVMESRQGRSKTYSLTLQEAG